MTSNTKPIGVAYEDQNIIGPDQIYSDRELGYTAAAQGTVTQATDKSTAVTLNKSAGRITMNAAALGGATNVSFTLNNSFISSNDVLIVTLSGGIATAGTYNCWVNSMSAGCVQHHAAYPSRGFAVGSRHHQLRAHSLRVNMASKKSVSLSVGRGEKKPTSQGAGLTAKGREKYNRETGSNLKAPAPHPKTEADKGRKASFCARMGGVAAQAKDGERARASMRRGNCK